MSEWSYYDKNDVIRNVKKSADAVDSHQREIRALRDEVKSLRGGQRELLESNRRLTEAFTQMAREMQKMREDMYPTSKTTKKGLQPPKTGATQVAAAPRSGGKPSAMKPAAIKPGAGKLRNPL